MNYIIHIDGDAFFVSCETASRPELRNASVVVGLERGMVIALNYAAKSLGIVRGMPMFQIRRDFPETVIYPSHFALYQRYANRLVHILRQYTDVVQEYSIDECFFSVSDATIHRYVASAADFAHFIKDIISTKLGISYSFGMSTTKCLAKLGSKRNKPAGITVLLDQVSIDSVLKQTLVNNLWGVGYSGA